jgi:drug/metabolite transporter (DMT)-like permease
LELTPGITVAVLAAAILHAAWNAMIKSSGDKLLDTALVCLGGAAVVAPFLFFIAVPAAPSWPYLGASLLIHIGYFFALAGAYKAGDLSHSYPIMRGLAPLIVSLCALAWFGEAVRPAMWVGIALICGGVLSLGLAGFDWKHSRAATAWAVLNAFFIATYTLVDAAGVRLSGSPEGYVFWMFFLDGAPFGLIVLAQRRSELLDYVAGNWRRGLIGGACSAAAYGIAVWAMARAPVAAVAALRECSVVIAALIGALVLKESFGRYRLGGACAVAAGVIALRL